MVGSGQDGGREDAEEISKVNGQHLAWRLTELGWT